LGLRAPRPKLGETGFEPAETTSLPAELDAVKSSSLPYKAEEKDG